MSKYLLPLKVFVGGQVALLVVMLFFPALGDASTQLAADTAGDASLFWGWTWVVGSVKLIVFLVFELLIFYATARAILGARE